MTKQKMKSEFIQEQHRYKKTDLCELLECSEEVLTNLIKILKSYSVLKSVRKSADEENRSDLQDEDIISSDCDDDDNNYYYVFTFVGVLVVGEFVLKCYPKYIKSTDKPTEELKQVIKVVEKYSSSKEQTIKMMSNTRDGRSFNLLAVLLYLLDDYFTNGIYSNSKDIVEVNGTGEIHWDKTINETFAFISNNRPYYFDLYTKKTIDDEYDYFKRLHECVLTKASKSLEDAGLLDLFGYPKVELTEDALDDFGETEYICYRLERELGVQFNTRKQLVLKTLYAYISQKSSLYDAYAFSIFGTSSFNLVWEDVCSEIFDNQLQKHISEIQLPIPLNVNKYDQRSRLIDLIEKPTWSITKMEATDTLIPDLVSINKVDGLSYFAILDAKYYTATLEQGKQPTGQPGIESITKQYLYQLAYKEFIDEQRFNKTLNCFLMPTEQEEVIDKGYVSLDMLANLGLENIEVRLVPASKAYECYLTGRKMSIEELNLI